MAKTQLDVYVKAQIMIEQYKKGVMENLTPFLTDLYKIEGIVKRHLRGQNLSDLSRARLDLLLADVLKLQTRVIYAFDAKLMEELTTFIKINPIIERDYLSSITIADSGIKIEKATLTLASVLKSPLAATGELLGSFISNWKTSQLAATNDILRKAWLNNWTNQATVSALVGKKGIIDESRRTANTVVRTAIQDIANKTRMAVWEENDDVVKGYIIVATLDGATTQQCRSLDGQEFKLGKGPVPPFHPGCRTTTRPKLDKRFAYMEEGATRSSEDGYINRNTKYYDWLKAQDVTYQNEILGPTRATLFRKGGISADEFAKLNIGRDYQPLTLDEMRKKAPLVFKRAGL